MKNKPSDVARLDHIADALTQLATFVDGYAFDTFEQDVKTQFAVIKALEIIGEAANALQPATRALDATIDWRAIIGLRHILVHEYYGIHTEILWRIVTVHTADLKPKILALRQIVANDTF